MRIIAGKFRGRKLIVPNADGLRPSSDRVRETLFNWLRNKVDKSLCLDLFAGSGALGLEALSRGAERVIFVEKNPRILKNLQQLLIKLFPDNQNSYQLVRASFPFNLDLLKLPANSLDLVFIDPPFRKDYPLNCLTALVNANVLKSNAWIYLETEKEFLFPEKSPWHIIKEKTFGQTTARLLEIR